jgi:type II secretory pathway component PulJ
MKTGQWRKPAMTLVELMAAAGMMVIILGAVGSLYLTGASLYRRVMESRQVYQSAQRVLHLLERDLKNAMYWEFLGIKFEGHGKRISFTTMVPGYSAAGTLTALRPAHVEYELRERALIRKEQAGLAMALKKQQATGEILLDAVDSVSLRYAGVGTGSKRLRWRPDWVQSRFRKGLPLAVRIELRLSGFTEEQVLTKILSIPAGALTSDEEDE